MFEVAEHEPLVAPVLVGAFDGWVSAGGAGIGTADHLAGDAEPLAVFDSDLLFDYRVNRPTVDFRDGVLDDVSWPEITVRRAHVDGRDLLVLSGPEPNWRWKAFSNAVVDLAAKLGVVEHVSIGGIPWAAPHTRPTQVITTASTGDRIEVDDDFPDGLLRVPGAVVSVIEFAMADAGYPTLGLWARIPHYVATTYTPGVLSLVERLSRHLGVSIPLGSLVDDAAEQRRELDAAIEARPEAQAMIEQLEAMADAAGDVPSGEELAAEIERFLRESGDDQPGD
ncbi:MAG: PAC2 family protein [Acidimicrobiia bacterium]|nr:PAC2 family protein [Acidimicrobiia bacterium]